MIIAGTETILSISSMFLFFIALCQYVTVGLKIKKTKLHSSIKSITGTMCAFGSMLCISFIVMQTDWIIKNHSDNVGPYTAWGWLIYNYAMGIYLITVSSGVYILANWQGSKLQNSGNQRRYDDR